MSFLTRIKSVVNLETHSHHSSLPTHSHHTSQGFGHKNEYFQQVISGWSLNPWLEYFCGCVLSTRGPACWCYRRPSRRLWKPPRPAPPGSPPGSGGTSPFPQKTQLDLFLRYDWIFPIQTLGFLPEYWLPPSYSFFIHRENKTFCSWSVHSL